MSAKEESRNEKKHEKLPLWCGALLICCVLTFSGMPKEVRAADGTLNLNETKNITSEEFGKRVYTFRVPNTGNFTVTIKNTNPTGNEELTQVFMIPITMRSFRKYQE